MEIKEVQSSTILPGKAEKYNVSKKQVIDFFLESIVKNDRDLYDLYSRNSLKTPSVLKTFLLVFENLLKTKTSTPEQKNIITKCMETVKLQLSLLDNIDLKSINNSELMVIFMSVLLTHLDDFLVD